MMKKRAILRSLYIEREQQWGRENGPQPEVCVLLYLLRASHMERLCVESVCMSCMNVCVCVCVCVCVKSVGVYGIYIVPQSARVPAMFLEGTPRAGRGGSSRREQSSSSAQLC